MKGIKKISSEWMTIVRHFFIRLKETPFLLGWLVIGPLIALMLDGLTGLIFGLINLVLLGIYAVLIRWLTKEPPLPVKINRPWLELGIALLLFVLFFVTQLLDFSVWTVQPVYGWVRNFFVSIYQSVVGVNWIPEWLQTDIYLAVSSSIKKLIPTLLIFLFLGRLRDFKNMSRPYWKLAGILVGITTLFGLLTGTFFQTPIEQIFILYIVGIFVNALPEELFFRGLLLPRLERVFKNPLNALVISAILFNAMHIPIQVHNGSTFISALLGCISIDYPTGLIWGYLYMRTRSIIPGTLWHAANSVLGFIMMSN